MGAPCILVNWDLPKQWGGGVGVGPPQHGTAAPAKHREQQKCTTYPLPCFPHGGLSKCKLPTPHRYLPHAATYPTREAAKCWPNRKLSPANDAQFSPGSAGLQKANPSCPNLCRAETHESSPCSPQHPRRSPQNPTPAFPTPEGKQNHPCDDLPWESLAHTMKMLREPCARLR